MYAVWYPWVLGFRSEILCLANTKINEQKNEEKKNTFCPFMTSLRDKLNPKTMLPLKYKLKGLMVVPNDDIFIFLSKCCTFRRCFLAKKSIKSTKLNDQVVIAQRLAPWLATGEVPGSNPGKGENLLISD